MLRALLKKVTLQRKVNIEGMLRKAMLQTKGHTERIA